MQGDFVYTGFAEYIAALNQASHGIDAAAEGAVEAGGQVVFDAMVNGVAVDTGALKAHLEATGKTAVRHEGNQPLMEIGLLDLGGVRGNYGKSGKRTKKKQYGRQFLYGVILEYGKANMAAQPYIRPAFDNNQGRVVQAEIASLKASGMLP